MAEFEPPSFSLGLDFDLDSQPQTTGREDPSFSEQARQSSSNPTFRLIEDECDFSIPEPPRILKRLRRGPASDSSSGQKRESVELCGGGGDDDDIEEFSSQEDQHREKVHSSIPHQSGCSSSKFSLHGHGVLTKQSASQRQSTKRKEASSTPASASLEMSSNKLMFPELTVSPLRRFQLIDSDSDDPSVSEAANKETNEVDSSVKEKQYSHGHPNTSEQMRTKTSVSVPQTKDLWEDFYTEKSIRIPTPALDEFCEEYFRSVEKNNGTRHDKCKSDIKHSNQTFNVIDSVKHLSGDPIPPAHLYFFHNDPRIQKIVSSRLPYFFPLGAIHQSANKHSTSSVIDYRSQFRHGEGSKQKAAAGTIHAETSIRRGRKNMKKPTAEEVSQDSQSWATPKSSRGIPKDAGKRRVHAVGQSSGQWYTGPDGKRVYISKNGQELTGRIAYIHYRKESGAGFKKSSKKKNGAKNTSQKKKPAAKMKYAARKK